jgi:hypothetical protein
MTKELREIPIEAFESKATIKAYLESENISTVVTPGGLQNSAKNVILFYRTIRSIRKKIEVKLKNEN